MTPPPQPEYIITEEQLDALCLIIHDELPCFRKCLYNPQAEREKVLELLNDLRRYANGEYKEADLSDNEHDMRIHLEYENRIWEIMIELRQSKDGEFR